MTEAKKGVRWDGEKRRGAGGDVLTDEAVRGLFGGGSNG